MDPDEASRASPDPDGAANAPVVSEITQTSDNTNETNFLVVFMIIPLIPIYFFVAEVINMAPDIKLLTSMNG